MKQLQPPTERSMSMNTAVADKMLQLPADQTHGKVTSTSAAKEPQQESLDPK
jgi:hypothetical protein